MIRLGDGGMVPKYLLGHSLGGLMSIYYTMTREISLNGLITIGKLLEIMRESENILTVYCYISSINLIHSFHLAPAIGISRPPNALLEASPTGSQIDSNFHN